MRQESLRLLAGRPRLPGAAGRQADAHLGGKAGSPATRNGYVVGTEPSPAKRDRVADIRLWNCDCLDVMSGLKNKEIPLTLTSVPFREEDVPGDYWETYDRWIREIRRCSEVALIVQTPPRWWST